MTGKTKRAFELVRDSLLGIDNRLETMKDQVGTGIDEIRSLVMGLQVALSQFHADQEARHTSLENDLLDARRRIERLEARATAGA